MFIIQLGFADPRDENNLLWANVEKFEDKASTRGEYNSLIGGKFHVRIVEESVLAFHIGTGL